ncbi:MAG: TetR/AcrR family transcriptional regulator [Defluviitaleaceae bacterium]|nr:TetR/AcrR family transcriptional regulator [Defluviitaleaceae bacterium]
MGQGGSTRRRGDKLLESIYDAATEIIREEGYVNLTFVKIARRAQTSRTVLYTRWGTPFNLIREIMTYRSDQALGGEILDEVKDTGSLRSDFLYLFELYQKLYAAVGLEVMNATLFEMSKDNARIPAVKSDIQSRNRETIDKLIGFAQARGEKIKELGAAARNLPFDLLRANFLWGKSALDRETLEQIVDEILLPVFTDVKHGHRMEQ